MLITYFAADFTDPALQRRVRLLRRGGAALNLLGFRRSPTPVEEVDGVPAIDLGRTFDGRLANRFMQVLCRSLSVRRWREMVAQSDALLARNLEMATIADAARTWANAKSVRLVYECLDIHGAQLGNGVASRLLRKWDERILRHSAALIVSSPAHLANYFDRLEVKLPEVILAENKRVLPDEFIDRPQSIEHRRPPWRIGWFGLLRCVESFEIMMELARRFPSLVEITLRGRPYPDIQNLIDQHLPMPNMTFGGPYALDDLADLYGHTDFTWAIEFVGQNAANAKWALGNRLYEGGYYNSPAFALVGTAMGQWLDTRHTGVLFSDPRRELVEFIPSLTPERYFNLKRSAAEIPTRDLVWTVDDCRRLANGITGTNA